jgi:hypothetical protein
MGWFWESKKPATTEDAYSKLDPGLRDFLDKESPLKQEGAKQQRQQQQQQQSDRPTYRTQFGFGTSTTSQDNQNAPPRTDAPVVPPESQFQDGRYADLWKTYRPFAEVEAAGKTDQDRMRDLTESYKDREAALSRAAMENCVLENMAERDCWANGSWAEKMNMCRGSNRQFNRCYTMQSRFLKALGYLSVSIRTPEEEEKIQMHADKLYHEMLAREALAEQAAKEGQEAPKLPPLISSDATTAALGEDSVWARAKRKAAELGIEEELSVMAPEKRDALRKRIEGMSEADKELEMQLAAAEIRSKFDWAEKYHERLEEEKKSRAERRERGRETPGDTIKRLWGWDKGAT